MLRINLDGAYFTNAESLDDAILALSEDEPDFDVSRLSVDDSSLKSEAVSSLNIIATQARRKIITEPDPLRLQGLTTKALLATFVMAMVDDDFRDELVAAGAASFEAEANLRGLGETPEELMRASSARMMAVMTSQAEVEGAVREALGQIEELPATAIAGVISRVRDAAEGTTSRHIEGSGTV